MYIRHFEIRNYMIHRETQVDLFPITVLVGSNGGGKSAFFDALLNFSMVSRGRLTTAFGPGPYSFDLRRSNASTKQTKISYRAILSATADSTESLEYEISYGWRGGDLVIHREIIRDQNGKTLFDRDDPDLYRMGKTYEHLTDEQSIFAAIRLSQFASEYTESHPLITEIAGEIGKITRYRLEPASLSRPSALPLIEPPAEGSSPAPTPRLSYNGEGLSSILYYLNETRDPTLELVVSRCRQAFPGFDGFSFNFAGSDKIGFSAEFDDGRGQVNAPNLSDGMLTFMGLVVLLSSADRTPVVCLEEPENGLTPTTTRLVYELMLKFVTGDETVRPSQLLISSHSPYVVCEAWNGDNRDFIYQLKPSDGRTLVRSYVEMVAAEHLHLEKDPTGTRSRLNLRNAELLMDGYLS